MPGAGLSQVINLSLHGFFWTLTPEPRQYFLYIRVLYSLPGGSKYGKRLFFVNPHIPYLVAPYESVPMHRGTYLLIYLPTLHMADRRYLKVNAELMD